jgi:hypothetical protein
MLLAQLEALGKDKSAERSLQDEAAQECIVLQILPNISLTDDKLQCAQLHFLTPKSGGRVDECLSV